MICVGSSAVFIIYFNAELMEQLNFCTFYIITFDIMGRQFRCKPFDVYRSKLGRMFFHWSVVIVVAIFVTLVWTAGLIWLALHALHIV
jgi:hypothetical protein